MSRDCAMQESGPPQEVGPPMRERSDPERTRELMILAQSIATQVETQVPRGRDRWRLRRMVEMFLDE